jgi:hypothetical protein
LKNRGKEEEQYKKNLAPWSFTEDVIKSLSATRPGLFSYVFTKRNPIE